MLAESVEQVEPPPELRQSLMATVREEAAADAGEGLGRRRAPRPSGVRGFLLRPAAGLAAVALGAAGVAGYLVADGGEGEDAETVADLEQRIGTPAASWSSRTARRRCEMQGMEQLDDGRRLPGVGGGPGRGQALGRVRPRRGRDRHGGGPRGQRATSTG